jgi:uncharacterized repeat protein (TIGR01451 family)
MKNPLNYLLVVIITVLPSLKLNSQCLNFSFEESTNGSDLLVDVRVENFTDILSLQLAFGYPADRLQLLDINGNSQLNINQTNLNAQDPGYVTLVWFIADAGETLADNSSLLQFRFQVIDPSPASLILIDNDYIEIVNNLFENVCYTSETIIVNDNRAKISGSVTHDKDDNCLESEGDLPLAGWTVKITSDTDTYYGLTNPSGQYLIPVELGEYTVEVLPINDLWMPCLSPQTVNAVTENTTYQTPIVISPIDEASALSVTMKAQRLRRCSNNNYQVIYKNDGTIPSTNTSLVITLDENLEYIDANIPGVSAIDQIITADLGLINEGQSGSFSLTVNVNCENTVEGETLCAEADISSDDSMIPPSDWDGAVLMTDINCDGDSVKVTITNVGTNDVQSPLNFIVIEDDVMLHSNETDPSSTEQRSFKYKDNGAVYRVIADQPDGYPYGAFETDFVQSCDDDNSDSYSFVSMFPNADDAPLIDVECHELVDSFDPNDILAYPAGYRSDHRIDANQDIEYTLRFQNTGTDTVFNITIENIIDESLDIESLRAGSSSHDYVLTILENGKLRFEFYNILLPQSTIDIPGSNGFVSYKISQKPDLPEGTQINNSAEIFFDYNESIVTNTYTHLIGDEYIEVMLNDKIILLNDELIASPNPAQDVMKIEVNSELPSVSYILYDTKGLIVNAANSPTKTFYINKGVMQSGLYILEIRSDNQTIGRKKLIFN